MKNTKFFFRLLVVILFFVTACGDKEDAPKPPSRTELLAAKTWKMNKVLGNGIDATNEPMLAQYKTLQFKFNADGAYTLTSLIGAQTGTWAFADNETKVILDPNTASELTWNIVELKDNSLKLRSSMAMPPTGQQGEVTLELVPAA
jgi:hypothetical protein